MPPPRVTHWSKMSAKRRALTLYHTESSLQWHPWLAARAGHGSAPSVRE